MKKRLRRGVGFVDEKDCIKKQKSNSSDSIVHYNRISMNGKKFFLGDSIRIHASDADDAFGVINKIYTKDEKH